LPAVVLPAVVLPAVVLPTVVLPAVVWPAVVLTTLALEKKLDSITIHSQSAQWNEYTNRIYDYLESGICIFYIVL